MYNYPFYFCSYCTDNVFIFIQYIQKRHCPRAMPFIICNYSAMLKITSCGKLR